MDVENQSDPNEKKLPDADFGGDVDEEEDISSLDRGDSLEPVEEKDEPSEGEINAEAEEEPAPAEDDSEHDDQADDSDDDSVPEEADGEPESEEEPAEEEAEATKPQDQRIPKKRFDEVNRRRKEAEAELEKLKNEQQAAENAAEGQFDFNAAEAEYAEFLLDGKLEDAAAKRNEIRAAEREVFMREQQAAQSSTINATRESLKVDQVVSEATSRYPEFDPDSESYDELMVDEVGTFFNAYRSKGFEQHEAMKFAIENVVKVYDLAGPEAEPEPKPKPKPRRNIKDKIEQQKKAPPNLNDAGVKSSDAGETGTNVSSLSEADFDKLPESTKKRLRGDLVA